MEKVIKITPFETTDIISRSILKSFYPRVINPGKYFLRVLVNGKQDPANREFVSMEDIEDTYALFESEGLGKYIIKPILQ